MGSKTDILLETRLGKIRGLQEGAHQDFLGIRYAQAPVGDLRFLPPQPVDQWQGICDATHYAPIAPQAYPDTPPIQLKTSEDCLTLNIHTPSADGKSRPVMVYIHGGGFLIDSGSRPRTYGGPLAERGDVVVTIEYRMGALGFLYTPGISPNLGLQDQVCALGWIQRHIHEFGGDPANVTIFGESAGATSVAYLMVMPSARGLFHKAILESGAFPLESTADNLRFAHAGTNKFLNGVHIAPGDLPALQRLPLEQIMQVEKKVAGRLIFNDRTFYPVIDGVIIPQDVYAALRLGCSRDVPVILGVNAEELPIFGIFVKNALLQAVMKSRFVSRLKARGATGYEVQALLDLYRQQLPADHLAAHREVNHLVSDENFRLPAILFAEAQQAAGAPVYFYNFIHPAPKTGTAMHVMEVYFVFGTLKTADIADLMKVEGTEAELRLSQAMMNAWSTFARSGCPDAPGLPTWEPYEPAQRATMLFGLTPQVVHLPGDPIRAAWMQIASRILGKKP